MSDEDILEDALRDKVSQTQLRTAKDYIDIYEAAGCPREVLVSRMMGKPSLRRSSLSPRRRSLGTLHTQHTVDVEDAVSEPPLFHVTAPRDPLPAVTLASSFEVTMRLGDGVVDLEADIQQRRMHESAAHRDAWLEWWHRSGRASDIARLQDADTTPRETNWSKQPGSMQEQYLTLKSPGGHRTRFEALSSQPTLARPVSVTLQRVLPVDCHRSTHYPAPPSAARLAKLPLPDRQVAKLDPNQLPKMSETNGSALLVRQENEGVRSPEVRRWQQRMGLLAN
jgi:hypothetical protein